MLWIEPIPEVFEKLQANLSNFPRQKAVRALVGESDGESTVLHVSGNDGLSSSVLDLAEHADIWPEVGFVRDIPLTAVTLPTLLHNLRANPLDYDTLVLDTQGSELSILRGAIPLLAGIEVILSEVADFEAYRGCARRNDLSAFLERHGFQEWDVSVIAEHPDGRRYFDIIYR